MNVYELEKQATPGPFHEDDGFLYAGNGNIIANLSGDGFGLDMTMIVHCRNNFMKALGALKTELAHRCREESDQEGIDALDALIVELEEVKP
jgi:hypothetical protein